MAKNFEFNKTTAPALLFAVSLLVAPLYVWRFSVGIGGRALPTNFLMIFLFIVIAVLAGMVWQEQRWAEFKASVLSLGKPLLWGIGFFSVASIISLVAFGVTADKLSQWVVIYFQPIVLFFLVRYFLALERPNVSNDEAQTRTKILEYVRIVCYALVGAAGVLAIMQYFTLMTLPPAWWGNTQEPKRAIAFFAHPNAFGLFITPLLAWLIPDFVTKLQVRKYWPAVLWMLGGVGILLSLSRGAWLGLIAAAGVFVLAKANKKLLGAFVILLVIVGAIVVAVPNLRYRVLLPFYGEKSSGARVSLWHTGWAEINDSPILGKGVNGFKNNWEAYNRDPSLEHYNFPHNIFLNFWIDSGLLGLISMMLILGWSAARGLSKRTNPVSLGLALFVIALFVHGLLDIPYFKNDLALVFWLILGLSL